MTLWLTLKNMFARPGRLIVLLLCFITASIAACAAFDLGSAVSSIFSAMITNYTGDMDCMIGSDLPLTEESFAGCPPCNVVLCQIGGKREVKRDEKLYTYELSENATVYGFADMQKACDMKVIRDVFELGENEVAIGKHYSESHGYGIGSVITLTDIEGETFDVTVSRIFEEKGMMSSRSLEVIAPLSVTKRLCGTESFSMALVDTCDTPEREFEEIVREQIPGKSTLLYLIGGLDTDYEGSITVCGKQLEGLKEREMSALRRDRIGFVFSVVENPLFTNDNTEMLYGDAKQTVSALVSEFDET